MNRQEYAEAVKAEERKSYSYERRPVRRKVGTVHAPHPMKRTQHYETAAWYRDHEIPPQIVDAFQETSWFNGARRERVFVAFDSKITGACLVSLCGGVPYGRDPGKDEIGKHEPWQETLASLEHWPVKGWRQEYYGPGGFETWQAAAALRCAVMGWRLDLDQEAEGSAAG